MPERYDAFISYRHNPRDTSVARELQTRLEHYHIPKALQQRTGRRSISRIFRDQNELEVTSDLSAAIDEALAQSDFLICVLSPAYKESVWCIHEIEQFLKTHDYDHILTVLSDGEPPAIFPDLLLHRTVLTTAEDGSEKPVVIDAEPLACDYRMNFREAARLELPRLLSAILHCEYDELVLRSEHYRRTRLLAGVSVFSVLAAAAIAWLLYSNARIRENYRQAQINESRTLANTALSLLQDGKRLDAVRTALKALPSEQQARPVTDEAQYALCRSTLAYQLPFQTLETRVTDRPEAFETIVSDPDHHSLYALSSNGQLSIFSTGTKEQTGTIRLFETETIRELLPLQDCLYAWTAQGIVCIRNDGSLRWKQELNYSVYGRIASSADGSLIAAGDLDAVQLMKAEDGTPVRSLPLRDSSAGYIDRIAWSDDGTRIGVSLRSQDHPDEVGMFDLSTGAFEKLGTCGSVRDLRFTEDNALLVLSDSSEDHSIVWHGSSRLIENEIHVLCFTEDGTRFDTAVPFSMPASDASLASSGFRDTVLVSASDTLSLISTKDGEVIAQQQLDTPILSVLSTAGETVSLITSGGSLCTVSLSREIAELTGLFPQRITAAVSVSPSMSAFAVLYDGNIHWYEAAFDSGIRRMQKDGFLQAADGLTRNASCIIVTADCDLLLYDRTGGELLSQERFASNETGILPAEVIPDDASVFPLLVIRTDNGEMRLELRSCESLKVIQTIPLAIQDYFSAQGYFQQLAELYGADSHLRADLLLKSLRSGVSEIAFDDGIFCYFEGNRNPLSLHFIRCDDGSETEVHPEFGSYRPVQDNSFTEHPSVRFEPAHETAFVLAEDGSSDTKSAVHPAAVDLKDGTVHVFTETAADRNLLSVCMNQGYALCGTEGIDLYDASFQKTGTIPYPGVSPLALSFHENRLYIILSDGRLEIHAPDGALLNTVQLSFDETDAPAAGTISLLFSDQVLAIRMNETLDLVHISASSGSPFAHADHSVLSYDDRNAQILVYTHDSALQDQLYHLACFPCYSAEDLILRGTEELRAADGQ